MFARRPGAQRINGFVKVFMSQDYVFKTARLGLRELSLSDQDDLGKILCDKDSMKYYRKMFLREDVKDWILRNINRIAKMVLVCGL